MLERLRAWLRREWAEVEHELEHRAERGTTPHAERTRDRARYEMIERKLKELKNDG
jgi:hypothetical protein